jgi:hypothetical protein
MWKENSEGGKQPGCLVVMKTDNSLEMLRTVTRAGHHSCIRSHILMSGRGTKEDQTCLVAVCFCAKRLLYSSFWLRNTGTHTCPIHTRFFLV